MCIDIKQSNFILLTFTYMMSDNMVYAVDGGKESANNRKESEDYYEVSQEHFYELTESNKMMELSSSYYAEIGPFNEVVSVC